MLKQKGIPFNTATPRQAVIWSFWGIVAGIYCCQPLLGLTARDRISFIGRFVEKGEIRDIIKQIKSKNLS